MDIRAIERCGYCRRDVPVTWVDIGTLDPSSPMVAHIPVCKECWMDGR